MAVLEALKGVAVLLAGCGLLSIMHHGGVTVAQGLVAWLRMDPASDYARSFVDAVSNGSPQLWSVFILTGVYAVVRFVEAYGLWRARRWAEWLAVASFGIYLPFEIYEMLLGVTPIKTGVLALNVVIVAYLARALWASKRALPTRAAI